MLSMELDGWQARPERGLRQVRRRGAAQIGGHAHVLIFGLWLWFTPGSFSSICVTTFEWQLNVSKTFDVQPQVREL